MLSVIIEGVGKVKLGEIKDIDTKPKQCEEDLREIKKDLDYLLSEETGWSIQPKTAESQHAKPDQIKRTLNPDVKPLNFKSREKQG